MKVLVTGLNGFTGRHLAAELLAAGHSVVGLKSDLLNFDGVLEEVRDSKPDAVVHLAGISFVAHGDINKIYNVNILGARNLLVAIDKFIPNVGLVMLASSANVYGNQDELLSESAPLRPLNDYAVSKLAMECMAKTWLDRLPITIVRPFNYTGVGQSKSFLIPKIIEHYRLRKSEIELGNVDIARDFSDVRDVVTAYRLLLEKKISGEIFNICSGKAVELGKLLKTCSEISGHYIEVVKNDAYIRNNEIKCLVGDNTKIRNSTGLQLGYNLNDTLEWMLNDVG
ncbi:NAD-dependent epimerase/dehydratase family protein [Teredinibacter turnerae]|uniref:NAD-dependent epimerase/dehydratase family protein n=1 Tax=Teredinibacter turnerae TaxID=2426 RepID=UPI00049212BB|nr:NAD-dependent epimerase/dehydratase family protein [Teredinibacter turnerae]